MLVRQDGLEGMKTINFVIITVDGRHPQARYFTDYGLVVS